MEVVLYPITYWLVGYFGTCFVVGSVTNAAVAFASYQDSRLRNSCNILIALASIADCLHLAGQIVLVYAFATGNLLMSVYTCVWIEFLPMVGFNSGCAFTVAIGIDRLFACFSPIAYGQKRAGLYISCHLAGVFIYLCFHFYNVYIHLYPTELICMVPSNYLGEAKGMWWKVSYVTSSEYRHVFRIQIAFLTGRRSSVQVLDGKSTTAASVIATRMH